MSDITDEFFDFGPDPKATPRPEFVDALRSRLAFQERIQRSRAVSSSIAPYLAVSNGVRAVEFYASVFGAFVVGEPFLNDSGLVTHAELNIQGARIYVSDEFPEAGIIGPQGNAGHAVSLVIAVADADLCMDAAIMSGARVERPLQDQWGSRSGWFIDPFGHRWSPTSRTISKPTIDTVKKEHHDR